MPDNFTILADNRFKDGTPRATDTGDGDFSPENIAIMRPAKKHKFAEAGTKYYYVDVITPKAASLLGIHTHNLGSASALVSVDTAPRLEYSNDFLTPPLDTANIGTAVNDTGTVVQASALILTSTSATSAAMAWDKNKILSRIMPWSVKSIFATNYTSGLLSGTLLVLGMYQDNISPAVNASPTIQQMTEIKFWLEIEGVTTVSRNYYIAYRGTDGIPRYWTGSEWTTSRTLAFTRASGGFEFLNAYMRFDGDEYSIEVLNFTETVTYAMGTIDKASIQDDGYDDYVTWGDLSTVSLCVGHLKMFLYEHTGEGDYTERLAPFTPSDDKALIKSFAEVSAEYWRVKIVTASVAVFTGIVMLSLPFEFPAPPDAKYDPHTEQISARGGRGDLGGPIGPGIRFKPHPARPIWSRLLRSWVMDTFKPVYDAWLGKLIPFLYIWSWNDPKAEVLLGRLPASYKFRTPLKNMKHVDKFRLDIESTEES